MTHAPMGSGSRRPGRAILEEERPASWKERIAALRYIPPLARLIWKTHAGYTLSMMLLRLVRAFVPIATFWVGKLILDTVIAVRDGHAALPQLWKYVGLEVGLVLVAEILARASSLIE